MKQLSLTNKNHVTARQKKLRLFLLDEQSGRPARSVRVNLVAELRSDEEVAIDIDAASANELSLGLLQSDHVGYVSFHLEPIPEASSIISRLFIRLPARPGERHYLSDGWDKIPNQAIPIRVRDASTVVEKTRSLPSVQNPDATDWTISPGSFSAQAIEVVGQDGCETLLLSNAPVQRYGFVQVMREPVEKDDLLQPAVPSQCDQKGSSPAICFRRGVVVEYEVTWRPMGHGLGEVLYSLPLAPCESVKMAIIDWARTDAASRGEDLSSSEQLFHNQRRDRTIEEIVRGTISEWQRGGSLIGAAGGTYSYGSGSIAASLGAAYLTSAGDRNAAADTVQRLADAIAQASTAARRLQSTVVVQASQRESEQLQTRTVTNHNHCHALTVLYYEIIRHFLVETTAVRARDAIFLRHPEQTFDAERALRNENQLKSILTEGSLGAGFDAIRRRLSARTSDAPAYGDVTRLIIKTTTGDEDTGLDNPQEYVRYLLMLSDGQIVEFRTSDANRVTRENWLYRLGRTNTLTYSVSPAIRLNSIVQVGVSYHRPGERPINWRMAGLEVTAVTQVDHGSGSQPEMVPILRREGADYRFTDGGEWWADADIPAAARGRDSSESLEDQRFEQRLLDHLNEHRQLYNRVLWLSEDPNRRASLLEGYRFESSGSTGRLIDFVDNRVVDVIGDYIVLPLGTGEMVDQLVPVLPDPVRQMIGVPTRGAFAEAKLSNCNACEEIDNTRFWDWQESPCACDTPDISGIQPRDRARDAVGIEPSTLPASSVRIEGAPSAPDPTGMSNILELLGRSDIFRDMSGRAELASVMQAVVNGAVQLQMERLRQEAAAQQRQQQGSGSGTGSQPSSPSADRGGSAESNSPSETRERTYRQAENAIDRAERSGSISEDEANAQRRRIQESRLRSTETDPLATASPQPDAPAQSSTPTQSRGTRSNPWIIDNFEVDRSLAPAEITNETANALFEDPGHRWTSYRNVLLEEIVPGIEAFLASHPGARIRVDGYTDRSGSERRNNELSLQRAQTIARDLDREGIPPSLTDIRFHSSDNPRIGFPDDDGEFHNRYNRRVEIWVEFPGN